MARKRLSPTEASYLGLVPREGTKDGNAKYYLSKKMLESLEAFRKRNLSHFKEVKRTLDSSGRVITKVEKREQRELIDIPSDHKIKRLSTNTTTGQQWVISEPMKAFDPEDIDFDAIVQKYIKPIDGIQVGEKMECDFDVLTYSDLHIGMDTDKYKSSLYPVEWNRDRVMESCTEMIEKVITNQESDTIVVDDLGDLLDGFNAKTTRGGHDLPQNMTNEESFDCALEFKMTIVDNLVNYYPHITFNNICCDNHSGSMGYFVNSAFESIVRHKYPFIKVNNHRKFINHYFHGEVCFVITHGKDDRTLKFGFKTHADASQVEKIDQYCKQYGIYHKAKKVIFKKGDSHQCIFDMATSDDFDYFNYPAMSPSSQWVQNNFKKGRRGFVIEHFTGVERVVKPFLKC